MSAQQQLTLGGDGSGVSDLDTGAAVTLTVSRVTTTAPPATQVTDALAGRAQTAAVDRRVGDQRLRPGRQTVAASMI